MGSRNEGGAAIDFEAIASGSAQAGGVEFGQLWITDDPHRAIASKFCQSEVDIVADHHAACPSGGIVGRQSV